MEKLIDVLSDTAGTRFSDDISVCQGSKNPEICGDEEIFAWVHIPYVGGVPSVLHFKQWFPWRSYHEVSVTPQGIAIMTYLTNKYYIMFYSRNGLN